MVSDRNASRRVYLWSTWRQNGPNGPLGQTRISPHCARRFQTGRYFIANLRY